MAVDVRPGEAGDLPSLVEIYNHHVLHGTATFDEEAVTVEDRRSWFETFDAVGPHRLYVAVDDGRVIGYACSRPYRDHPSFAETVELSAYVDPAWTGRAVGSQLYERLIHEVTAAGAHRAVVGIALPNEASFRLHRRFGFVEVGTFDEYARKWGRYVSSTWMQRTLRPAHVPTE